MTSEFIFSISQVDLMEKSLNWTVCKEDEIFSFNVRLEINIDEAQKSLRHTANIEIQQSDSSSIVAHAKIACVFSVPNISEYRKEGETEFMIPDELILLLNTVTIGTVRGVLFSEFRGTFLHDALLPVIDPRAFKPVSGPTPVSST